MIPISVKVTAKICFFLLTTKFSTLLLSTIYLFVLNVESS